MFHCMNFLNFGKEIIKKAPKKIGAFYYNISYSSSGRENPLSSLIFVAIFEGTSS